MPGVIAVRGDTVSATCRECHRKMSMYTFNPETLPGYQIDGYCLYPPEEFIPPITFVPILYTVIGELLLMTWFYAGFKLPEVKFLTVSRAAGELLFLWRTLFYSLFVPQICFGVQVFCFASISAYWGPCGVTRI